MKFLIIFQVKNYKKLNNEPYLDFINIYLKKNIFENIYKIVSQLKIIEHSSSSKRAYIDISNLNLNFIKNQIINKIKYSKKLNSKKY